MYMQEDQFAQAMKTLSNIVGVPEPNTQKISYYFKELKGADYFELKSAFGYYGQLGKWPTVREMLNECGLKTRASRQQCEAAKRNENSSSDVPAANEGIPDYRGMFSPQITIQCVAESEDELTAKKELDAKMDKIKADGWTVYSSEDFRCKQKSIEGRSEVERTLWKRHVRAFRYPDPKPELDKTIARFYEKLQNSKKESHV